MKKLFKGLAALAICGALSFGLTNEAQAAEIDPSSTFSGVEAQELYGPPPPPPPGYGHRHGPPPPPPPGYGHRHGPPPPPPHHRHGPPPPPPRHGW